MMEIIVKQRNPYRIDGPAQIGFSGGRSSAYMLRQIVDAHNGVLPDDVYVVFENTGREREETLIFVDRCASELGVNVYWIEYCRIFGRDDLPRYKFVTFEAAARNGEPFDCMLAYYDAHRTAKGLSSILPNFANKMCSAYLKTKAAAWLMANLGYEHWDAIVGIRRDEPHRYHRAMAANDKRTERWETYLPMYIDGVTKQAVNDFWRSQPFDLGIDSDLGNCDLCWKKHPDKILRAINENPSSADWWVAHEDRTGQTFRNDGLSYRHLKFYAEQASRQESLPFFGDLSEESVDCACTD
jgi:3'-phosphoadenosine 5'-phosphosulfate sulfotransferase (PAPS reductase)/FAD synthetase